MSAITGFRIAPQQAAIWRAIQSNRLVRAGSWLQIEPNRPLSLHDLEERLHVLIRRHEILRTKLHLAPGMALPIQVIQDNVHPIFRAEDWRSHSAEERQQLLRTLRDAPADGYPLQIWHVETGNGQWLLLKGCPTHLDLRSLGLIATGLLCPPDPQDRLQYVDYTEWKQGLTEEDAASPPLRFWQNALSESLSDALPGLQTPADDASCDPALLPLTGAPGPDALAQAAHIAGLTIDEFLFAAWCSLLARLRGQTKVGIAWLDEGRGEGLEQGLGLYEQFLPVHAEIDLDAPLAAQSERLLRHLREARGWSDYYAAGTAAAFYFACRSLPGLAAHGRVIDSRNVSMPFILGLDCGPLDERGEGGGFDMRIAYDRAHISEAAIGYIEEQWLLLLRGLCGQCEDIGAISLAGDRQLALLEEARQPAHVRAVDILDLIDERVRSGPGKPALADALGIIDYGTLHARSNVLARRLVDAEIRQGDVVGILLNRDHRAIVAMLAVLRAGATYLPLDPSYPADRLTYMIEDSGAALVICREEDRRLVPDIVPCLPVEELAAARPDVIADAPACPVDPQGTAYLIYTSGSTGKPKGVPISRASLSHSTQVRMAFYKEPVNAYLLLSSFAFDSSVAGIYWTLCQGGLLVLPASGEELDLAALTNLIETHRVDHGLSLPSFYETLLDFADPGRLASLRCWIVAGEACTPRTLDKHDGKVPHALLVNEYGPTEATVWATAEILTDAASARTGISIGKPIPGMTLRLLNDKRQLAAIGEPGEIHLGGPTLSRGYLAQPGQTAKAFVSYPHIGGGERLYRTGDLARYRVDGKLDFLGRCDHQIKIRGFRVEPGEIERVLRSHSEIHDAVVVARRDGDAVQLVAYFTERHGYAPDYEALRGYLHDRLPVYMIPSIFVRLEALPQTPNGKLDLNALPDPDHAADEDIPYLAPRTEMETALAEICAQVLKRERVGVLDSFFRSGGDSILSLQIVSRASQRNIRISAKQIFECETIEKMSEVAEWRTAETLADADAPSAERDEGGSRRAGDFPLARLDDDAFNSLLSELNATD